MSRAVANSTRLKAAKIPENTWREAKHESVERGCGIGDVLAIATRHFLTLPESRREKLVRETEVAA